MESEDIRGREKFDKKSILDAGLQFRAALLTNAAKARLIGLSAALAHRPALHCAVLLASAAKERENQLIRAWARLSHIALQKLTACRTRRSAAGTAAGTA